MSEVLKQVDDRSNFHHGERMKPRFQALVLCQSKIEGLWVVCVYVYHGGIYAIDGKVVELMNKKELEQDAFFDSVRVKRPDFATPRKIVVRD